ncbi:restriction endonuclease subunit S [Haemophilus haemolyticus]|uniref:restriction endonuclease subunit S n=1 Tax=Haemophilus haemolyticus TaxID=726 RepID=UPI000E569C6D|nr:restriction endonuclease subunit S [Haemophilus haemolyticus]
MSNLGQYLKFSNGKTSPNRTDTGFYPVYGANGIIGYSFEYNSDENTIIIGRVGSYCGSIHFSDKKCWVTDNAISARSMNLKESIFWFYYLKFLNLNSMRVGSGQPLLNQTILKSISLPDLNINKIKVGEILLSFDQKIDLNTQINQTLEQITQALFKIWFVDFDPVRAKVQALSDGLNLEQAELAAMQAISGKTPEELTALSQTQPDRYAELAETAKAFPCEMVEVDGVEVPKGWEVKPLGDLISFVKGKKPKAVSPKQEENMLPHILTSSLEGKYNEFCESNKLVTVEYQNTIMLMDGSNSGRVAIGHNGVIGSTLAKINFDNNKLWAFIYQFLKHKEADIQANTTGTTIPHTDKNRINNYLMTIPNDFLLDKFTELFDNSLLKIISNRNQIISLETTRDLLLPRLLSGVI